MGEGREEGVDENAATGPQETPERRRFLSRVIRLGAGIIALTTLIPGVGMVFAPVLASGRRKRRKVLLATPNDMNSDTFVAARYEGLEDTAPGIFVRKTAEGVQVLSAKCTHAGCAVQWQADKKEFFCPCHQGHFDENGKNIAGPPPRPLDRVPAQIVNNEVYIEEPEA